MKNTVKQKGITLIALIVTIVILIILAGISINTLVGDNGIITKAKQSKENTEQAIIEEETRINSLYDVLMSEENIVNIDKTIEEMKTDGSYVTGNIQVKDDKGNKVVIPDGFKVAIDSGSNVSEGIVIEDNDLTMDGKGVNRGNQFVWIPVGNITRKDETQTNITLGRYTFTTNGTETLIQSAEEYMKETIVPS